MAIYRHRILYEKGVISKLAEDFSVHESTVRNALRYSSDSKQAKEIRNAAVQRYACQPTKIKITDGLL